MCNQILIVILIYLSERITKPIDIATLCTGFSVKIRSSVALARLNKQVMGRSLDVAIEVEPPVTGGTFTNYDVVRGKVHVRAQDSVTLNHIEVKLEGVSTTQLRVPKRDSRGREHMRDIGDVHKLLYRTLFVFPPENVRQVSSAKQFTLTAGEYEYPFEFEIPLNNLCYKVSGIKNKFQWDKNTMNVVIRNEVLEPGMVSRRARNLVKNGESEDSLLRNINYHISNQLPPSFYVDGGAAHIEYFVKATCKRLSFFKANQRTKHTISFMPLNIDQSRNVDVPAKPAEVSIRKEVTLTSAHPNDRGKKRSGFRKLFEPLIGTSETPTIDLPFGFEARFNHPMTIQPGKSPSFRLYFVTFMDPRRYLSESREKFGTIHGLSIIYLQRIIILLVAVTKVTALEHSTIDELHHAESPHEIPICDTSLYNVPFDLKDCKRHIYQSKVSQASDFYELQIPDRYIENKRIPTDILPSFKTCNVERYYYLRIVGGFSKEKVYNLGDPTEVQGKVNYIDLQCSDINVPSTMQRAGRDIPTMDSKHSEMDSSPDHIPHSTSTSTAAEKPSVKEKEASEQFQNHQIQNEETIQDNNTLPTYDDVLRNDSVTGSGS